MEKTSLSEMTTSGSFRRSPSTYRSTPTAQERMDPNRFVLYVSLACPWANRCLAALHLKKLEDRIRVSVVHPVWQRTRPDDPSDGHCGWAFRREDDDPVSTSDGRGRFDCAGCVPDPLGRATVRDIYADSDAKFTVVRVGRMIKSTARPPARARKSLAHSTPTRHPFVTLSPSCTTRKRTRSSTTRAATSSASSTVGTSETAGGPSTCTRRRIARRLTASTSSRTSPSTTASTRWVFVYSFLFRVVANNNARYIADTTPLSPALCAALAPPLRPVWLCNNARRVQRGRGAHSFSTSLARPDRHRPPTTDPSPAPSQPAPRVHSRPPCLPPCPSATASCQGSVGSPTPRS